MLDVTTNQNINCSASGMTGTTGSGDLDDDMDPLFDNDWLHENNLDILFDLFEEEMERKERETEFRNIRLNFNKQTTHKQTTQTKELCSNSTCR